MTATTVIHARVSGIADTGDPDRIQGPDWDDGHVITYGVAADLVADSIDGDAGTTGKLPDAGHSHPDPLLPQFAVQRWYGPTMPTEFASLNSVGGPLTIDRLYAIPFEVGDSREYDRIGTPVKAAASTAQLVFGVYADDGGQPGALLLQSSPVDASVANTLVDAAFDMILSGLVWLAAVAQTAIPDCALCASDNGAAISFHDRRIGLPDPLTGGQLGANASTNMTVAYSQDSISGALPDPWGSTFDVDPNCAPYILLRAK